MHPFAWLGEALLCHCLLARSLAFADSGVEVFLAACREGDGSDVGSRPLFESLLVVAAFDDAYAFRLTSA
jgi:hypothetical protein